MSIKREKVPAKKIITAFVLITTTLGIIFYITAKLNVNPFAEKENMIRLEKTKQITEISEFETDGCSGNVSEAWTRIVKRMSGLSDNFANRYSDARNIPFEYACIEHDLIYHKGEGGYAARLQADNDLRSEIISYAINNVSEIMNRTGLNSEEETLFLYEKIADAVFLAVRVAGGPCSGKHYAWGFGYGGGHCE